LRRLTVLIGVFLLCFYSIKIASNIYSVNAEPRIIKVPEDYEKIQWAVGNASAGDTILVASGLYYEHISINKPLSLIGEDKAITIINGGGDGNIIEIWSDNVTVQGFTIQNGTQGIFIEGASYANISSNLIKNTSYAAIRINDYSNNNTILNNVVKENDFIGIYVYWYSDNNTISHNYISNNDVGIEIGVSSGNIISDNVIENSVWEGILLFGVCKNNIIYNNSILLNDYGISLEGQGPTQEYQPTGNLVYDNIVTNNDINIVMSQSSNNIIYHNSFIKKPYYNQVSSENSINEWDNGIEGNFWSDYSGVDLNGDCIGDTSYIIDENNTDRYPLIVPYIWNYSEPIPIVWEGKIYSVAISSNSTVSGFKFNQPQMQISFKVSGSSGTFGYSNVTIPKSLLSDNPWTITIDGQPPTNIITTSNNTHSFLYFTYIHGSTKTVTIKGTHVIPEFHSTIILTIFMLTTTVLVALTRNKRLRNLFSTII
jgi:parallel beta-helix repeat protein